MSDYRHTNGNNSGNDYVLGPGEHFMGDGSKEGDNWIVSTFNTKGRNEMEKAYLKREILANAKEGSRLETHLNADGSETFVLKTPTGRTR